MHTKNFPGIHTNIFPQNHFSHLHNIPVWVYPNLCNLLLLGGAWRALPVLPLQINP